MISKIFRSLAAIMFALAVFFMTVDSRPANADDVPTWQNITGVLTIQVDYPTNIQTQIPLDLLAQQLSAPNASPCVRIWQRVDRSTVWMQICFDLGLTELAEAGQKSIGLKKLIEIRDAAQSLLESASSATIVPSFIFRHVPGTSEASVKNVSGKTEVAADFIKHKEELAKLFD